MAFSLAQPVYLYHFMACCHGHVRAGHVAQIRSDVCMLITYWPACSMLLLGSARLSRRFKTAFAFRKWFDKRLARRLGFTFALLDLAFNQYICARGSRTGAVLNYAYVTYCASARSYRSYNYSHDQNLHGVMRHGSRAAQAAPDPHLPGDPRLC